MGTGRRVRGAVQEHSVDNAQRSSEDHGFPFGFGDLRVGAQVGRREVGSASSVLPQALQEEDKEEDGGPGTERRSAHHRICGLNTFCLGEIKFTCQRILLGRR